MFENISPQKPRDWDFKPGDFENMYQIKLKWKIIQIVMVFFTLLEVSVLLPCCSFGSNEMILFQMLSRSIGQQVAK